MENDHTGMCTEDMTEVVSEGNFFVFIQQLSIELLHLSQLHYQRVLKYLQLK